VPAVRQKLHLSSCADFRDRLYTQYTVHTADYAANNAANDRSHGTSIVLADASAMIGAVWYALSARPGRQHGKRHRADK
jgi:hypothetical protein